MRPANILAGLHSRLIETRVVFELLFPRRFRMFQHRLIETRVVFEFLL